MFSTKPKFDRLTLFFRGTAKKCTEMSNARAEALFSLIKTYCFVPFSLPLL